MPLEQITQPFTCQISPDLGIADVDPVQSAGKCNMVDVPPLLLSSEMTNCAKPAMQSFVMTGKHLDDGHSWLACFIEITKNIRCTIRLENQITLGLKLLVQYRQRRTFTTSRSDAWNWL